MTIEEKKADFLRRFRASRLRKEDFFLKWKSVCVKTTASALVRKQNPLMYYNA